MPDQQHSDIVDLFIIGGGINGCGIARDAAGRGLRVELAEMNDLGSATSSASTKLFHGGLRYLEYFEIGLVREALREREVLLRAMPHISWPMRFVLPVYKDMRFENDTPVSRLLRFVMPWMRGRRPAWLIRLGLFMYDRLGGRKILPPTSRIDLRSGPEGAPLKDKFTMAYEYSDCWVEDSRLVVLNARDARERGAQIRPHTKVMHAERVADLWEVTTEDAATGRRSVTRTRALINASGPWVKDVISDALELQTKESIRLVRGSHIVTRALFDHDKCYFFQGEDGRIIFAIPYESDFTLIGTTDADHPDTTTKPTCSDAEADYLRAFASNYFKTPVSREDIVWSYAGVRPLYDDGAGSAAAATRSYVMRLDASNGAPLLNIFGGKITTYRKLAEHALEKITPYFPKASGDWTAGVALAGGDFPHDGVAAQIVGLRADYAFLDVRQARRLVRAYGTEARIMLGDAKSRADLGADFGAGLSEREVRWLMAHEFARTGDDILWRRSKLGLRFSPEQSAVLQVWIDDVTRSD